ncbi:hypothetical protein E3N88_26197 [Mikania micrantha]|uniref:Multifunctional fusion protein n=1 Tax=Mikania micrantha TaxID=192012 RepID=A0A5N6N9N6_9ASTR|nr:hypothetical protein E3N88_26197 [Mikania micrantha]
MMILGENVNTLKVIDSSLRLIVIPLSIASFWLTLSNHQENDIYGRLDFSNLKGLKFLVSISAISAGYALISVVSSWVKNLMNKAWIFFVCDQGIGDVDVGEGGKDVDAEEIAKNLVAIIGSPWPKAHSKWNTLLVIVEKAERSDIPDIDKKKYLVPADLTVGQFVYVVRKRIKLSAEKAIFIFVKNILPPTAAMMSAIYEENKDEDGFLYMTYSGENTFGLI